MAIFGAFWLVFGVREAVLGRSGSFLVQTGPTDPKNHACCNPGSPDDKKGAKGGKKGGTTLGGFAPEPPATAPKNFSRRKLSRGAQSTHVGAQVTQRLQVPK